PWPGAVSLRDSAPADRHAAMSRKTPSERSAIPRGYGTGPPSRPVVARSRGFAGQIPRAERTPRQPRGTCAGRDAAGRSRRDRLSQQDARRDGLDPDPDADRQHPERQEHDHRHVEPPRASAWGDSITGTNIPGVTMVAVGRNATTSSTFTITNPGFTGGSSRRLHCHPDGLDAQRAAIGAPER